MNTAFNQIIFFTQRGGKFLKKLWCCVGGGIKRFFWFYQMS